MMVSPFDFIVDSLMLGATLQKLEKINPKRSNARREYLPITGDFEATKSAIEGAMLFPKNADFRVSYGLRNRWSALVAKDSTHTLSSSEVRDLLNVASRGELRQAAVEGVKHGTVAGDLLGLIYEQWRINQQRPSLRSAIRRYREFSAGKHYGDDLALINSDAQVRTYLRVAEPSAHLWAALRLLKGYKDRGKSYKSAFMPEGMPYFLSLAKELQNFATTFIPKGTSPEKPIICESDLLLLPETVFPVCPEFRVL